MTKEKKAKEIKIKGKEGEPVEKEVEGIMNAIKGDQIQNGNIPDSSTIIVSNFAGRKTKRDKSVVFKGKQYFLKKGTAWEDVDNFFRKWVSFSTEDFE